MIDWLVTLIPLTDNYEFMRYACAYALIIIFAACIVSLFSSIFTAFLHHH